MKVVIGHLGKPDLRADPWPEFRKMFRLKRFTAADRELILRKNALGIRRFPQGDLR